MFSNLSLISIWSPGALRVPQRQALARWFWPLLG